MKVVTHISPEYKQLTKDVASQSTDFIFLVFHNEEIIGYCESELVAKRLIDNISTSEEALLKEVDSKWTKVLKENDEEGVRIYVQKLGRVYNGEPTLTHSFSVRRVNALTFHKGVFPPPPPVKQEDLTKAIDNLKSLSTEAPQETPSESTPQENTEEANTVSSA